MATGALIGRDGELAELEHRARTSRLVTIVGPGGVGKTALARAVADRLGSNYPLGARFVDLTRIDDEAVVPSTIADQLGFDSFDALLSSPNDRPLLLLVDNCEHLLDAVAATIVQVLGACHQPTVLATSRSPLELPGESIVSLAPLAVPAAGADAMTCASVQLFLARCRDAGANVGESELAVVVDLCRRLDGLPLAIEIAAARARTMSVADIASRLAQNVDVLDRPRFRGDPRHRSVADTIRWSYDLLTPDQADLLEHLAVFAGPFTVSSARSIVQDASASTLEPDLDELVNASLVVAETDGLTTRYRLLDTVRRFGLDQLRRHDRLEAAYDRFVDHVVASVRETMKSSPAQWYPSVVSELVRMFGDIAEAIRWCVSHDETSTRAYRLCSVLWVVVHQGHADDIVELARRTLVRWPDVDGLQPGAQVAAVHATGEYVTGHPDRALHIASESLARLNTSGPASITLHRVIGQASRALGETDRALEAFATGAAIGHEHGMTVMAIELEAAAALVKADQGDVEAALGELQHVIDQAGAVGSVIIRSWACTALAWVMLRHDLVAARPLIDAALEEARRIDYPISIAVGLRSRAYAELLSGDSGAAVATATELMRDLITRGALSNGRVLLDVTAAIAYRRAHPAWEQLVATARALPITTLASAQFELVPIPATSASPLPRHDAIGAVWNALGEMSVTEPTPGQAGEAGEAGDASIGGRTAEGQVRRLGDVCEFTFAGRAVTLRAAKGVDDLLRLIEADGREIHCLDLVGAGVEAPSTGEVIDATARRNYEQKIRDLQSEIDEAESNSDYARAYKHQAELDTLIDHLTAALGHGNRTRRAAGSTERARSAVTHRLRTTIRQLGRLHPVLGRHLSHAVNTGTYCSYRPEQPTTWRID
jgi:predicted ATPase